MGKEVDQSTDTVKPTVPAVHAKPDGTDSAHLDSDDHGVSIVDDQVRLSQGIWFGKDIRPANLKTGENGSSTTGDGVPAAKKVTPPDAKSEQGLMVTPIQTVLAPAEATPTNPEVELALNSPTTKVGESPTAPVDNQTPTETADKPAILADGSASIPPVREPQKEAPVDDKQVAGPAKGLEVKTDEEIGKLRQAIVDADSKASSSLKTLVSGRGQSLALVGKLTAEDMVGKTDVSSAAVERLKTQEIKQAKEYTDYLEPGTRRTDLGTALIARGDDVSVKEGERMLVEAVQARPDLIFHPNFRAQVMDSYHQMAEFRKSQNLEPWKADIDIRDLTAKPGVAPADTAWTDKTDEHFKAANDAYFGPGGIKAALPEFQKAIESADETATHNQDRLAQERLDLFVGGLKADRAIAQGQVTGESTTEMEKRRVDIWDKQIDNYVEDATGSRARMNVGLAKIASGDPEMLAEGNQQIVDTVAKHPGLVYAAGLAGFGNEFTERLFGAYKANADRAAADAKSGDTPAGSAKPVDGNKSTDATQKADEGDPTFAPGAQQDLEAGYKPDKLSKSPLPDSNTDRKVEGYGWDKATDIGLPIAVLAMGLYTGRRQYHKYQEAKAAREASFAIEPTDSAAQQKDVITRKGPGGEERLEIKGRAQDGQVVARNLNERADTSGNSRAPIDPPKDFNPAKNKYGEYQPVKVDGKKYFLNSKGEAFEHRGGQLHPTDSIRGLKQSEVAGHELKPLPSDMQRTSFQNLGRELTAIGALPDGRIVLENSTTGGAPQRDTIKVPDNVDPLKGEFNNLQHQRLAGRDYFISPDNKVYTFLQPERVMQEAQRIVVKPADAVYSATGMPGSSAEERAINKKVNDILEPLRVRLRSGEEVDALTRAEYMDKARDALMPAAKDIAKSLGLPENVITDQTFRFADSQTLASHDPRTGEITLNIFGDSHLTSLDHEIKHKKQSLDKIAAADADPAGFRDAILDRSINDIGKPGRRFTDDGIDSRPEIKDPKAVEQLQKLVRDQVMRDYAERGLIPRNQAPPATPDAALPPELIKALGNVDTVRREVMREAQNFKSLEKQNLIGRSELNEGSQKYVDQKVESLKRWQTEHTGTTDGGALKNNPEVKQMLESVAIDTLGTHQRLDPSLRPYYKFSPTEIDARKQQVDAALERLTGQLKSEGSTTKLEDHPKGKQLIERGQIIDLQQQLLKDFQNGDVEEAKGHAQELLKKMESEPQLYTEDVRFMQQRGLLSAEQTAGTKFEPLLRAPLPSADGTTPGDTRIAALETPGFTPASGEQRKLDLASLDATRDRISLSPEFKGDVGQKNVYDLLSNPNSKVGVMAKLKAEGRIGPEWDVFPTAKESPADMVGADYLLVNRKTGDFYFLDATKNPDKLNVFKLRQDGIILYKSEYFTRDGELDEPHPDEKSTTREKNALAFKAGLEQQIEDLTKRPADFNLNTTPMPDVVKATPENSHAQVDRLIKWADGEAKIDGETHNHGPFSDMRDVLTKGVQEWQNKQAIKAESPEFDKAVRSRTQKEIAKYVAAKVGAKSGPRDIQRTGSEISARDDKLELVDGERIQTTKTSMTGMLKQEWQELSRDPMQVIKHLSKDEIVSLDPKLFNEPPYKGKAVKELKAEIEKAYAKEPRGQISKVLDKLKSSLSDNRTLIEAGGKEGTGPKVIENNVIDSLSLSRPDDLLGRKAVKEKAPKLTPGEAFTKQVPNASEDLKSTIKGLIEGNLGDTANKSVADWMQEMVHDAEKKGLWDTAQRAKFKDLTEKYNAGDPETVHQVNDLLAKAATDAAAKPSDLDMGNRPTLEMPSPVGAERLGHFRDLLGSIKGLEGNQFLSEVGRIAKAEMSATVSRGNRPSFSQTQVDISESTSLKPGQSELVIHKGNEVIKPTSFLGGSDPVYITADGTRIPAKDVNVEIKLGAGSSKDQAAREALVRSHQLVDLVEGRAKPAATALAESNALRNAFDKGSQIGDSSAAGKVVADGVVTLGEFEFQSRRQSVELTRTGVKIGDQKEITFEKLVRDTTRDKRAELDRLQKEKLTSSDPELEGRITLLSQQVADLEQLGREIGHPESVANLVEAIRKQATPEEVARLKAEREKPGGEFGKAAVAKVGAYALVAVFLVSSLAGSSPGEIVVPLYAPTRY